MNRRMVLICFLSSLLSTPFYAQRKVDPTLPEQFLIGRDSFFDFGPPFHYYEIILVQPNGLGSQIDRILITPPGGCTQPSQVEVKNTVIPESTRDLIEGGNPCAIREKELHKERKRCKHCLVFSGMNVTMRAQCGNEQRQIRMDILDRDIYDPGAARTPQHTSWTMRLLQRIDQALGPGPMEKPIFNMAAVPSPVPPRNVELDDLAAGKFDSLFEGSSDKVSELYRQAQHLPTPPAVELVSSEPIPPVSYKVPEYPPLAKAARVSGVVRLTAHLAADGRPENVKLLNGQPLLRGSAEAAIFRWVYPKEAANTEVRVTLEFKLPCSSENK